ncbi:uncharacterized protein [Watersipora subatra]
MVRDSFPELQSLVNGTAERRRSTQIPLDKKNSRVLRQSIANYQGQSTNIQDEIVNLEQMIGQLKTYTLTIPASLPVEDEHMHGIEMYMKNIGCSACKVRSMLKSLEPKTDKRTSMECSQSTIERRGSYYNTKYTQYQTLAVTVNSSLAGYKETIDAYYTRLVSSSEHQPMSYWVVAEDEEDPADAPLVRDLTNTVLKTKQKLSVQEREIIEREKRIREWHKLLSTTFHSKHEPDDDSSSNSSPLSYDIEAGLVKVHEYTTESNHRSEKKKKSVFAHRLGCSLALALVVVLILLGIIAVVLFYYGGFRTTLAQNTTIPYYSNETRQPIVSTQSTTKHTIQAIASHSATQKPSIGSRTMSASFSQTKIETSKQTFTTREVAPMSTTSTSSTITTARIPSLILTTIITTSTASLPTVGDETSMTHSATRMASLTNAKVTTTRTFAETETPLMETQASPRPNKNVSQTTTAVNSITTDEDNVLEKMKAVSSTTPLITTVKQGSVSQLTNVSTAEDNKTTAMNTSFAASHSAAIFSNITSSQITTSTIKLAAIEMVELEEVTNQNTTIVETTPSVNVKTMLVTTTSKMADNSNQASHPNYEGSFSSLAYPSTTNVDSTTTPLITVTTATHQPN